MGSAPPVDLARGEVLQENERITASRKDSV